MVALSTTHNSSLEGRFFERPRSRQPTATEPFETLMADPNLVIDLTDLYRDRAMSDLRNRPLETMRTPNPRMAKALALRREMNDEIARTADTGTTETERATRLEMMRNPMVEKILSGEIDPLEVGRFLM